MSSWSVDGDLARDKVLSFIDEGVACFSLTNELVFANSKFIEFSHALSGSENFMHYWSNELDENNHFVREDLKSANGHFFQCKMYYDNDNRVIVLKDVTTEYELIEKVTYHAEKNHKDTTALMSRIRLEDLEHQCRFTLSGIRDVVSSIAHHWRQPLNAINLEAAAIMHLTNENQDIVDRAKTIIELGCNLSETINSYLEFTASAGVIRPFTADDFFHALKAVCEPRLYRNNIELKLRYKPELVMYNDKNALLQSVVALMTNSMEAYEKNPELTPKIIEVKLIKYRSNVELSVIDGAGGIAHEIIPYLFTPYMSTKSQEGTGIGLAFCKATVEKRLEGLVEINHLSSGTSVKISFPRNIHNEDDNDEG